MYEVFQAYLNSKISLTEEQHEYIRSVCILKKLRKKQYLLQEGDVWKYNAFVTYGCLRTYTVDEKGSEHIIGFAIENWWTGDRASLLNGEASQMNIDAIEDSELVLFTKANFDTICATIPAFNDMISLIFQNSLIANQNRILSAISDTAEERYRRFVTKYPAFALRIPQSMIASYLGISPETLSRVRNAVSKK